MMLFKIIDTFVNTKTNVLYFCNAGKDRTGVVSAILLDKIGADREEIISDYMETKENLRKVIETYVKAFPNVDKEVITPHERYMEEFLDWLQGNRSI